MKEYAIGMMFLAAVIVALISYRMGAYEASERFYDVCQGGEVQITYKSGTVALIGCAEIARHIR